MTKKSTPPPAERALSRSQSAPLAWRLALTAVVTVPLAFSFLVTDLRAPKDLLFLAFAVAIAVAAITESLYRRAEASTQPTLRTVPLLASTALAWTGLSSLFSTNHTLSLEALRWVAAVAVFAIAIDLGGRTRGLLAIAWSLLPAVINAAVFLLQRFHVWNPFTFQAEVGEHLRYSALLGNPDDVGGFLVVPALVAVALALTDRPRRWLWLPAAAVLLLALATGRLTSLIACGVALLTMGFIRSWRGGVIATLLIVVASVTLIVGYAPMRKRASEIASAVRARDYSSATAGRVTPFLAAARMSLDHPLVGVGPGCFRWRYFDYKLAIERAHPSLAKTWGADYNFRETHNDHLQTLAETGIVGYALFVTALIAVGTSSFRRRDEKSQRDTFVRTLALPLAVGISVLCLAHFPLHLAASTTVIVYVAVLCVAWGAHAEIAVSPSVIARVRALLPQSLPTPLATALTTVVAIGGLLFAWHVSWQPWRCAVTKRAIEARTIQTYDAGVSAFRAPRIAHANIDALEPCLKVMPTDVGLYMLMAANARLIGRFDDAAAMYRKALQYDQRPELYYNLGLMELQLQQRGAAIADLLTAVRFSRQYMADLPLDVQKEITDALREKYPYLLGT